MKVFCFGIAIVRIDTSEASLLKTMWPSKTLAVVVFMLQVSQSPSCTFTKYCGSPGDTFKVYANTSTSLYDCLKACYFTEYCNYVTFSSGLCLAYGNAAFYYGNSSSTSCYSWRFQRDSIANPEQCKPVSSLL
uniref:Apple domain-containing protein n=1 Tax=Haemonchus contortus TaxID=6289 RepID=A0A7I4YN26_HAECO